VEVVVKLFAGLRERAGTGERRLELPEGTRLSDVWAALDLGEQPPGLLYAVNKAYAATETELRGGERSR
jgi:molybdopterin converting factor small subunit